MPSRVPLSDPNTTPSRARSRLATISPTAAVRGIPNRHLVREINENASPSRLFVQHPT